MKFAVIMPTFKRDPHIVKRAIMSVMIQLSFLKNSDKIYLMLCSDGGVLENHIVELLNSIDNKYADRFIIDYNTVNKVNDYATTIRQSMSIMAKERYDVDYCCYLDDDNIMFPDYIYKMKCKILENKNIDFIICRIIHNGPLQEYMGTPPVILGNKIKLYEVDTLQIMVKTSVILKDGWLSNYGYFSDGYTFENLANKYNYEFINDILGIHF